jgi:uncharacterized membrane protein (UPF0127 family)
MRVVLLLSLALTLAGCGQKAATLEDYNTRLVTLPGGRQIRAEVLVSDEDMARGMMFRDSLAPDRGMLFLHRSVGSHAYWMYQVKIPLDIVWMDSDRRIVEISANTPPCTVEQSQCPTYGGHVPSQYVLELAGGMAARYGLKDGDTLEF